LVVVLVGVETPVLVVLQAALVAGEADLGLVGVQVLLGRATQGALLLIGLEVAAAVQVQPEQML
jgi:hypothetical protein